MERIGDEIHVSPQEARAGNSRTTVRTILLISLALAIGALSAIWIIGALRASQDAQKEPVIHRIETYQPSRLP